MISVPALSLDAVWGEAAGLDEALVSDEAVA
jgi:hypothetical protein